MKRKFFAKRKFFYITTGKILERLAKEGLPISRPTFRRLEKKGVFALQRTPGNWRVASPDDVEAIVKAIKEWYRQI